MQPEEKIVGRRLGHQPALAGRREMVQDFAEPGRQEQSPWYRGRLQLRSQGGD
jgi:hypothetical protein